MYSLGGNDDNKPKYADRNTCTYCQLIEAETKYRHFADDICECIFLNENALISIKISLNCIPNGPINNIPALFQIMA